MGTCSCMENHAKDTTEALVTAMVNSDSPASVAYKQYESQMIPDLKELYKLFLQDKGDRIKIINIRDKVLSKLGSDLLSKLFSEVKNLEELILVNNEIGVSGAEKLSDDSSSLRNLKRLIISNNQLTDAGLETIAQTIPFMTKLVEINFSSNLLTSASVSIVQEMVAGLQDLEILDLTENNFTKSDLVKIMTTLNQLGSFSTFKFDEYKLEPVDVAQIKKILKKNNIMRK